jgi:acyl transferase domain-containing protein/NADPH:quinone reductase-like Zn-dependent oxidoreductase/SAM-dependent methyltransferase/acyl carrier protein
MFLRYAQGYVAIPVVVALRDGGLFDLLDRRGALTLARLASELGANHGHLAVATRLVEELGWIAQDADGQLSLTPSAALVGAIPHDIGALVGLPLEESLRGDRSPNGDRTAGLQRWVELSARRWDTADARLAGWLDGVLVLPLLVGVSRLKLLPSDLPGEIAGLFVDRGWAVADGADAPAFTELGRHMVDRALVMGVAASYAPLLRNARELLFGSASRVLQARDEGHEIHVDRSLNVVASGFQHDRYFKDIDEILLEIFDRQPLDRQPRYIADMGSGDGTLLERCYRVVCERTARGRDLDARPLTLIAADLNEQALAEARARLRDVPCLFVHADISDPGAFVETLGAHGVHDPSAILHLRSFLDHDRTLAATIDGRRAAARRLSHDAGVFVDAAGNSVPPAHVVQDLVEHLQRWAAIAGPSGLVALEVHSLPARVVHEHIDRCENLYFDALQGFSGQLLVPAATFVMAAAEAGLFPRGDYSRRYPSTLPFTRITLSWFEPRPYRVRLATEDDLPALAALEIAACEEGTRSSEQEIRRRLVDVPDGQCILEVDGRVAGVLYTQRIASPDALYGRTIEDLAAVHDPGGRFVQLIGLRVDPAMQQRGLGDQFLDFALLWLGLQSPIDAAVGVSRCRDFARQSRPLADYVSARDEYARSLDPILRFHQDHGATIVGVVPGFCPGDLANGGAGVLIRYDFHDEPAPEAVAAASTASGAAAHGDIAAQVEACVRRVLGPRRVRTIDPARPLMEHGLDSLDLMELRAQLETTLGVALEQTFFFEYPTCDAVVARLSGTPAATMRPAGARIETVTSAPILRQASDKPPTLEPIAIIGMGCRFPGGVNDPGQCWQFLRDGRSAVGDVPAGRRERWEAGGVASFFDEYPWIRRGAFLEDVAGFDASFFNIAPREAALVDPQQRLLLEVAWEALERAAIDPHRLAGTRAGVFLGIFSHDYELLQVRDRPTTYFDAYSATGVSPALAAGRIAYCLGLEGPAVVIDSACSSSLVATHLACQSLRSGESNVALAGGVNLMLAPNLSIIFAKAGMLGAGGRCRSFAAGADGYVRGEGCSVIVLKRLSDARRDGDRIAAVIRGSAVNQDGASNGLTAPNVRAQEQVVRRALESAGLDPNDVDYLEAHGTGTSLGDPIEIDALGRVFASGRDPARPLRLGSIKTNFGHLEAAAGLAGLMKAVLCLQHGELVPHLNFDEPSPLIPWKDLPIEVVTAPTPMPSCRVAGVSSFGFSGTNAHVILEAWPGEPHADVSEPETQVLTLSARTPSALRALAARTRDRLLAPDAPALADVCYTAGAGRAHFEHRLAIAAGTTGETIGHLSSFLEGAPASGCSTGQAARSVPGVAFLFTGQGSQYFGMGRELFDREPVFRRTVEECAATLDSRLGVPLLQVLGYAPGADPALVHQTRYTQPALFAVEYALAELWRSWGVTPSLVMGHSVGEYVAACVAGVFTLEDALVLLETRARLMQTQPEGGTMAAVMADEAAVERARGVFGARVSIAALNGPANTVISGERDAVNALCRRLEKEGIASTPLSVSHAFHSALMDPVLADVEAAAARLTFAPPKIRLVSNLTGAVIGDEICHAGYWARHLRSPVRFADGIATAASDGANVFLELGPRPVLIGMARRCLDAPMAWLPTLDGGGHDGTRLARSLAELYVRGLSIDWNGVHAGRARRKVDLPTYPFERESLWYDDRPARPPAAPIVSSSGNRHPLLGRRLRSPHRDAEYELTLDAASFADHRVGAQALVPGAAYVEIALAVARERLRRDVVSIEGLTFLRPLRLVAEETRDLRVLARPNAQDGSLSVEIHRLPASLEGTADGDDDRWELHARGQVSADGASVSPAGRSDLATMLGRCPATLPTHEFYRRCEEQGLHYGPAFRVVTELRTGDGEAIGRVLPPGATADARYCIDPVLLDGCFQVALAALPAPDPGRVFVPSAIDRVRVWFGAVPHDARRALWSRAVLRSPAGRTAIACDLQILDEGGETIAEIDGLAFQHVDLASLVAQPPAPWRDCVYEVEWTPAALAAPSGAHSELPWLSDLHERLSASLTDAGAAQADLTRTLEARSAAHVAAAFDELGWRPQPGERVDTERLRLQLGVAARHAQVFSRMVQMGTAAPAAATVPPALAGAPEIEMLDRCGASLAPVLRGECDPLQLIFPSGDMTGASRLYSDGASFSAMNRVIARAIAATANAGASGLRILELGAGTGATTAQVLPLLPAGTAEYLFTDLSPRFTSEAQTRFAAFPFLRAQRLDIEGDPEDQGVEAGSYDIVLASNVLHATRDLRETLTNARGLLRPGGHLVLLEGTAPRRWIDLTFGLLEGWWRFDDRRVRPEYPLLSTAHWRDLLAATGFDRIDVLEPDADPSTLGFPQAVIVARYALERPPAPSGHWLVLGNDGAFAESIAGSLRAHGKPVTVVGGSDRVHTLIQAAAHDLVEGVVDVRPAERHADADADTAGDAARGGAHTWVPLLRLVQALAPTHVRNLCVVTRGALPAGGRLSRAGVAQATISGLRRAIALEHPSLRCRQIDLDPAEDVREQLSRAGSELFSEDAEDEIAYRAGRRFVPRLVRPRGTARLEGDAAFRVERGDDGNLESLRLVPVERRAPGPGEVEISVRASALNFLDVLDALGILPFDRPEGLGLECAGEVVRVGAGGTGLRAGDRVMAIAGGSLSRYVIAPAALTARCPGGMLDEVAASIPIAFLTAAYALRSVAGLRPGQRVLIHAAAGGTGMAAVQIALAAGAEVFATASPWKADTLRAMGIRHVASSRTLDFSDEILRLTGGRGVDVVLNSLAGDAIEASLACLADGGHFVELGKTRILDAAAIAAIRPGVEYTAVDLRRLCLNEPERVAPIFQAIVEEMAAGVLRPLPRQTFAASDAPAAFRQMQQARHIGKVVLIWPVAGSGGAVRRDGTYLITGGTGGLGLRVAGWLAEQGAGTIVLMSRHADAAGLETSVDAIRRQGAVVHVERGDVSREADVAAVLARIAARGRPLHGVVHAAGVLEDGVVIDQTIERFERVMAPKVAGAWHLHRLTSGLDLDFFVLFSSTASLVGSAGQSNHAAANAYMDALAHYRRQLGLRGLSINWGAWAEIGAAASDSARGFMQSHGVFPLDPGQALAAFAHRLDDPSAAQVTVAAIDWPGFLARRPASPFFSSLAPAVKAEAPPETNVLADLEHASRAEQTAALRSFLRAEVAAVLGIAQLEKVAFDLGFFELGMDSLTSVEFRNNIQTKLGCRVAATVAFDFPTIDALAGHLLEMHPTAREMTTAEIAAELERELASSEGGVLSEREL